MYVTIGATIVGSVVLTTKEGDHVKRYAPPPSLCP